MYVSWEMGRILRASINSLISRVWHLKMNSIFGENVLSIKFDFWHYTWADIFLQMKIDEKYMAYSIVHFNKQNILQLTRGVVCSCVFITDELLDHFNLALNILLHE